MRELEARVRRYEDDYGIGPWQFARIDLGAANDYLETQHDLGVVLEVFSGMPGDRGEPRP